MQDHQLMTAFAFMQSYDRDVLDLQDDPASYIAEVEAELEKAHPMSHGFDRQGNKVWPVSVLRDHLSITGDYIWESVPLAT